MLTRAIRARRAVIVMIVFVATADVLCSSDFPITTPIISTENGPMAIGGAMRQGAADAMRDIKAGRFRILLLAETWQDEKALAVRDPETGYPLYAVPACEATECFLAAVDAYNDAMKKWHADHK
jgi:hypothetical protein